jgi:hypothetical protein
LRAAHNALIRDAATAKKRSPFKRYHSFELIDYIRQYFAQDIPQPFYEPAAEPESQPEELRLASGFGSYESNREIERAAVDYVSHWYTSQGWIVRSVEADKCGYDLHCTRSRSQLHVEVKGTSGNGEAIILTAGEFDRGFSDDYFVLAIVAHAGTENATLRQWPAQDFRQCFAFEPIQYIARLIRSP